MDQFLEDREQKTCLNTGRFEGLEKIRVAGVRRKSRHGLGSRVPPTLQEEPTEYVRSQRSSIRRFCWRCKWWNFVNENIEDENSEWNMVQGYQEICHFCDDI